MANSSLEVLKDFDSTLVPVVIPVQLDPNFEDEIFAQNMKTAGYWFQVGQITSLIIQFVLSKVIKGNFMFPFFQRMQMITFIDQYDLSFTVAFGLFHNEVFKTLEFESLNL